MPLLFAFNTAPMTLDPDVARDAKITYNQNSWAKFANLLYIDAPSTGFSYAVAEPDGTKPSVGTDIDEDSAIVLRAVVQFILRHPQLSSNRVVLVGESYGGIRATLMLQELYAYASLDSGAFQDSRLSADLRQYFSTVFGTESPQASQIASRFGHQVLIQPGLVGQEQLDQDSFDPRVCRSPGCLSAVGDQPPTCDKYFCDQEFGWFDRQRSAAATNLATVSVLTRALGVDPTTIRWMYSDARRNAYGRPIVGSTYVENPQMADVFGRDLQADDQYLMIQSKAAGSTYGGVSRWWTKSGVGAETGADFARHLVNGVATFMTSAKFDSAIHSPDIPAALNYLATLDRDKPGHILTDFQQLVCNAHYDPSTQTQLDRPGLAWMNYTVPRVEAWVLPTYESGHSITMRQPAALLADVMAWYRNSAHL